MTAARRCDLAYRAGVARARLDLWGPPSDGPLVVWAHGGGLETGSKDGAEAGHVARVLALQGWRVAVLDYRLYPDATWPEPAADLAAACAWALEACAPVGRWFLGGHSAGAYLAALVGLEPHWSPAIDAHPPAGLILVSGQMRLHQRVASELGVEARADHPAAPLSQVRAAAPAILALAGEQDLPGRWAQQQALVAALDAVGHRSHRAQLIPDRDHVSIITRLGEAGDPTLAALRELVVDGVLA